MEGIERIGLIVLGSWRVMFKARFSEDFLAGGCGELRIRLPGLGPLFMMISGRLPSVFRRTLLVFEGVGSGSFWGWFRISWYRRTQSLAFSYLAVRILGMSSHGGAMPLLDFMTSILLRTNTETPCR